MAKNNYRCRKRVKAGSASYYDISSLPARIRAESKEEKKRSQKRRRREIFYKLIRFGNYYWSIIRTKESIEMGKYTPPAFWRFFYITILDFRY